MESDRRRNDNKETSASLTSPNRGRCKSTVGHTPSAMTTTQKKGGEWFSSSEEVVAEGKSPPAPGEDGVAVENDVHRPDQFWPVLLHQHNLADAKAGSREHPLYRIRKPEGDEAPILDDDEELQEVGPQCNEGSQGCRGQAA
jgi:hypothetical protein